jgi:hypothetical protein
MGVVVKTVVHGRSGRQISRAAGNGRRNYGDGNVVVTSAVKDAKMVPMAVTVVVTVVLATPANTIVDTVAIDLNAVPGTVAALITLIGRAYAKESHKGGR